ncbi:CoA-transferase [Chelativorans sp. AA-79]|uniref:CoA transferase subunit A n=1 Tax=Chelativorans sp. AA-79 TaxID=3028735 RepID=UPI0023F69787|nr:CoA-transferase [Chelativorans sp. AA-79]WEX07257.1 CoA-transferase [Chelativorans sp. AA-79]
MPSKLISPAEAARSVPDGARIAFGGFAVYQKPMGFVRELVRQGRKALTVVGSAQSYEVDLLAAVGAVDVVETSYVGLEAFGLARQFRRAVEAGRVRVVDYPEMVSWDRFRANQENLPFWPVPFLGGLDIVSTNPSIRKFDCPLTGRVMYAVPAANPDVVVIHALAADERGNVVIPAKHLLPQSNDVLMARSCDRVIVTAEKIVDNAFIRRHANQVQIPSYRVEAVVEMPWGAHPTPALGAYNADRQAYADWVAAAESEDALAAWLDMHVRVAGNDAYLDAIGGARLAKLIDMGDLT